MDFGNTNEFEIFVILCWSIWRARNKLVFNGLKVSPEDVLFYAFNVKNSFQILLRESSPVEGSLNSTMSWKPPNECVLKLNVDAAVDRSKNHVSVGMVVGTRMGTLCSQRVNVFTDVSHLTLRNL